MKRGDSSDVLSNWKKPALILHGQFDNLCPPERHHLMQALMPQAELYEIEDAGHLPTLEATDVLNERVLGFLRGL